MNASMSMLEWHDVPEFEYGIPKPVPPNPDFDSNGEDRHERSHYDIEKVIAEFVDDPQVRHNVYLGTDYDEEGEEVQRTVYRRKNINICNGNMYEGQVFINGITFKDAVLDYAIRTGRNIKQYKYDKTNLGFMCDGKDFLWRIYCSTLAKYSRCHVTMFNKEHTYFPNGTCEMLKFSVNAWLSIDKIREEPYYFLSMKIEELIIDKWKICVTRSQYQHARSKVLRRIEREYDEQFRHLCDYVVEIQDSNSNSSMELECDVNDAFIRFYVYFDILKRTWKETCPLLCVDGYILKSKMKGQLLVVMVRDADNAIYPIEKVRSNKREDRRINMQRESKLLGFIQKKESTDKILKYEIHFDLRNERPYRSGDARIKAKS